MLERRKVDNNKIHKALFVNLRPLQGRVTRKIFRKYRWAVVHW